MLTCLCCFEKADFLNLTFAILGLLLFLDPQRMKYSYLRLMVAVFPLTYIYDIFWLVTKHSEFSVDKNEGYMCQTVLLLVWFLVFFKMALWLVMWKASLNFPKFVR